MKINKKLFWIYALNSSVYFLQGIGGIAGVPLSYYLKETLKMSPSLIMYIGAFTSLAWMVKPLIGFAIDNLGLKRKTWILSAILIDILTALFIGFWTLPIGFLVTVLMLSNWNTCFRDVAVDGIMVCEGKKNKLTDKIQSVQWIAITIAGMISTLLGSYLAEKNISYQIGFLLLIPFYFIGMFGAIKYNEEKTYTKKENFKNALIKYKVLFQNKTFLWVCLFLFLYKYSPSFGTPLWFIERDTFHWSKMFIGIIGLIGSIFSIIGMMLFYKFSNRIKNLKKWLYYSVFIGGISALVYLYFTPTTDIIYGIIFSLIGMFVHLLIMTFMAKNCIEGLESSSFAMLCSVSNLAGTASAISGAFLFPKIGLTFLIIISSLTSFLCLPLISKLNMGNKND
jgi:MFS family permease